jgi:hypothetical protein
VVPWRPIVQHLNLQGLNFQTIQRLNMFASAGAAIGLKALSHPTGALSRARDGSGGTGNPSSRDETPGVASGRRSPLSARFTDGEFEMKTSLGNDGNDMKLAMNNAASTPATRMMEIPCIGTAPDGHTIPQHDPPN